MCTFQDFVKCSTEWSAVLLMWFVKAALLAFTSLHFFFPLPGLGWVRNEQRELGGFIPQRAGTEMLKCCLLF